MSHGTRRDPGSMACDLGIAGAMLHGVDGQLQPNVECLGSNRWLTKKIVKTI